MRELGYSITIIAIGFFFTIFPVHAQPEIEISEDAFIVLVAKLGHATLFDELFGYLYDDSVLVPLSLIVEALEFPIEVNPAEGLADGWFLSENRRFTLNLNAREVIIEGQKLGLPKNLPAILKDDDIFVDVHLLEQWFPLNIQFSFNELALYFQPQEPLPIQQRLARKARREKQKKREIKKPDLPHLALPRRWLSWPQMDFAFDISIQPDEKGRWSPQLNYSTTLDMSLLALDSKWFFSGSGDALFSTARVDFSHPGFSGDWLEDTRFFLGDMSSPTTTHVTSAKSGIGFEWMNTPLDTPDQFDQITLEDALPPGWEIELYHNGQLLDFREIGETGRYRFENIDLLFGENIFQLVAYGPQGQKREQYKHYRIGQSMVPPGKLRYQLALNRIGPDIISMIASDVNSTEETEAPAYRYYANLQWGANEWLTLTGRWNRLTLHDNQPAQDFITLGARTFLRNTYFEWDTSWRLNPERPTSSSASRLHLQTQINEIQADLQYDYSTHFHSETLSAATESVAKLVAKLRGPLDLSAIGLPTIRWEWSNETVRRTDEPFSMNANLRTSTNVSGLSLSNNLVWSSNKSWLSADVANGSLLFGGRLHQNVRAKGNLSYQAAPEFYFKTFILDLNARLFKDVDLAVNISYDLLGEEKEKYSLSLSRNLHYEDFTLGMNLGYDNSGLNLDLGLSFSLGQQNGRWEMDSERMTGQGAIVARAFIDQHNDGQYDAEEDTLIEDVRYKVNGFEHKARSNAQGEALLTHLSLSRMSNISVVPASLPDPFLAPGHPGVAIKPNLGAVPTIDFPLISTGEIDGSIYVWRDEKPQAIKADLQLVDTKGKVVQEVRSAYDGFYLFSYVPMGKYEIRVAPKLVTQLEPESAQPIQVEIKPEEEFLSGVDMLLKPIPPVIEAHRN